jgi:hypothetical protein
VPRSPLALMVMRRVASSSQLSRMGRAATLGRPPFDHRKGTTRWPAGLSTRSRAAVATERGHEALQQELDPPT